MKVRRIGIALIIVNLIGILAFLVNEVGAEERISRCKTCYGVKPFFKEFNEEINLFYIADIKKINSKYSAVVVRGTVQNINYDLDINELLRQEAFGLFIVDDTNENYYMKIDIFPTRRFFDYSVNIERADEISLLISGQGDTYGDQYIEIIYRYDLNKKSITNKEIIKEPED